MVRCKFKVDSNASGSINMSPVYDGSAENKAFFKATPSGQLQFHTINEQAAAQLEVGKEYYIDIHPANG